MVASVALRSAPRATRSRLIASSARRPSDSRGTYAFFSGGRSSQHFGSWNCPRKSSSASGEGNGRPRSISSPLSSASTRTSSTRSPPAAIKVTSASSFSCGAKPRCRFGPGRCARAASSRPSARMVSSTSGKPTRAVTSSRSVSSSTNGRIPWRAWRRGRRLNLRRVCADASACALAPCVADQTVRTRSER